MQNSKHMEEKETSQGPGGGIHIFWGSVFAIIGAAELFQRLYVLSGIPVWAVCFFAVSAANFLKVPRVALLVARSERNLPAVSRAATVLNWTGIGVILVTIAFVYLGCGGRTDHVYSVPPETGDGIETTDPGSAGVDPGPLSKAAGMIAGGRGFEGIESMLVARSGRLVFEEYFGAGGRETLHPLYSATKSVTAALVGIAIDRGCLDGVGEPLHSVLPPAYGALLKGAGRDMTVEDILTGTSGLEWDELSLPPDDPANPWKAMMQSPDPFAFLLGRPIADTPGSRFSYNTGSVDLLALVIEHTCAVPADTLAGRHLLGPLGIERHRWSRSSAGFPLTGGSEGGLHLTSRGMLKIGLLFMREGVWKGRPVLTGEWTSSVLEKRIEAGPGRWYGYLWWTRRLGCPGGDREDLYARGYGGQEIHIIPSLELLVVFTGVNFEKEFAHTQLERLLTDYIIPAATVRAES